MNSEENIYQKICKPLWKVIVYFVIYVVIPSIPGIIYSKIREFLFYIGIGLINGGEINSSDTGILFGNLVGMFIFHLIFTYIISKCKFLENIAHSIGKFFGIDFINITFEDYINKIVLIGFVLCYAGFFINNYKEIYLEVIAIYLSLYSIFNSKREKNY